MAFVSELLRGKSAYAVLPQFNAAVECEARVERTTLVPLICNEHSDTKKECETNSLVVLDFTYVFVNNTTEELLQQECLSVLCRASNRTPCFLMRSERHRSPTEILRSC